MSYPQPPRHQDTTMTPENDCATADDCCQHPENCNNLPGGYEDGRLVQLRRCTGVQVLDDDQLVDGEE